MGYRFKNILKVDAEKEDQMELPTGAQARNDLNRNDVYQYFINVAKKDNAEENKKPFEDLLDPNDKKRILFVLPENEVDVFNSTSLLKYFSDIQIIAYIFQQNQNIQIFYMEIHILSQPYLTILLAENFAWAEGQGSYAGL